MIACDHAKCVVVCIALDTIATGIYNSEIRADRDQLDATTGFKFQSVLESFFSIIFTFHPRKLHTAIFINIRSTRPIG